MNLEKFSLHFSSLSPINCANLLHPVWLITTSLVFLNVILCMAKLNKNTATEHL